MPYNEVLKDGEVSFKVTEKPNGIIPLLKSFFSINDDALWVATSELATGSAVPLEKISFFDLDGSCWLRRVFLSKEEVRTFYHKTCKEGFWPILHSFPEKYNCDAIDWNNFEDINRRFAKAACEEADDEAIIWIHDYNLWLAPYYIRREKPNARISFFFHTPFPSPDIFNMLHWRQQIIESLLCCDLIIFDIPRYAENFVNTAKSIIHIKVKRTEPVRKYFSAHGGALSEPVITKEITYRDHLVRLDAFPEGTNYELIKKIMQKGEFGKKTNEIRRIKGDCKLIFAPSRIDYIKGTVELLRCYERLLARRDITMEPVLLFVVAVEPADGITSYREIQAEVERLVARINRVFSKPGWSPILYSKRSLSFDEMVAWFSVSDVLWVPSLRDGMNIICKEFVAVKKDSSGVLILSEFAGAAVELHDAVLTNPYSPESMNKAIDQALAMSQEEQKSRIRAMFARMMLSDINAWSHQLDPLKEPEVEINNHL
jgi:glucosylglycerol-phosphate synthase